MEYMNKYKELKAKVSAKESKFKKIQLCENADELKQDQAAGDVAIQQMNKVLI